MGLLLFIIALLVKISIGTLSYLYGTFRSFINGSWDRYNKSLAISLDQYGNCLCQYLFNDILIIKKGYKFGNIDETISSVLGKNKRDNTLTKFGKLISYILDKIEPNHVEKSIDNNI